jgi:hypothetical protein
MVEHNYATTIRDSTDEDVLISRHGSMAWYGIKYQAILVSSNHTSK